MRDEVLDDRIVMRTTRDQEFVLSRLEYVVQRLHAKYFSEGANTFPPRETKYLSECIIDGSVAHRHFGRRVLFDGTRIA